MSDCENPRGETLRETLMRHATGSVGAVRAARVATLAATVLGEDLSNVLGMNERMAVSLAEASAEMANWLPDGLDYAERIRTALELLRKQSSAAFQAMGPDERAARRRRADFVVSALDVLGPPFTLRDLEERSREEILDLSEAMGRLEANKYRPDILPPAAAPGRGWRAALTQLMKGN